MNLTKQILHKFDPEWIHDQAVRVGSQLGKISAFERLLASRYRFEDPRLEIRLGNLKFPNPIGLAAGFDKDGLIVPILQALGFGFIEVGTVTPLPQAGNPKPRLVRLPEDEAIINRMGFNNQGVDALIANMSRVRRTVPVGVNLGKNRSTPVSEAASDYVAGLKKTWKAADYFTINISSPNTADLRSLQQKEFLKPLIADLVRERDRLANDAGNYKQLWLKIAPDLSEKEIKFICKTVSGSGIDAMVISNTTTDRSGIDAKWAKQVGGLSGRPLFERSNSVLIKVNELLRGEIPTIGVGGIFSAKDIQTKLACGARLIQLYTSLVYEGPGLVKRLKKELVSLQTGRT